MSAQRDTMFEEIRSVLQQTVAGGAETLRNALSLTDALTSCCVLFLMMFGVAMVFGDWYLGALLRIL
jgi:hypothetical protein